MSLPLRRYVIALAACSFLFAARPLLAQAPTIQQSLDMRTALNPRISHDGRLVAYEVTWTNWEQNEFQRDIWIADTQTGRTYRLTDGRHSSTSPRWSPDCKWLAFLSDRPSDAPAAKKDSGADEKQKEQIWLISPFGGEARQITDVETGVERFAWSPDGRRMAFTAPDPESKAHKAREKKYGDFRIVDDDYTMTHLWEADVPGTLDEKLPKPERLTGGDSYTVGDFSWSPDGTHIAFDATRDPALSDMETADIYVLTLPAKTVRKIVDTPSPDVHPVWSPDGKQIAYNTSDGAKFFYYTNQRIAEIPAEGGTPRVLTRAFDEDAQLVAWGPGGIYFSALHRTYSHLFRLDPQTLAIKQVTSPESLHTFEVTFSKDFSRFALVMAHDNGFPEIAVSSAAQFSPHVLTSMGDQLKPFRSAARRLWEWKSGDGAPIEGVLIEPADFNPAKKYPLFVVIHGGPTGVSTGMLRPDRYYPIEQFVAKGALVLEPNYRGSAGYGSKFRALNVRNLGVGDYADVISGVDSLIAKGWVDPKRVGAMGWSEGGYISAFITASSDRFRAVSVGAGISDWLTYYVNTDIHPFTRQYLHATPWQDPEIYRKTSPITYILHAQTPTLIQQGSQDARVPVPDSFELYQALKDLGVPVKFVLYTGFGHPIIKPKQQRAVMQENYNWFAHYIWGDPLKPVE
jgi:dipeptidyl aminopeptidase/acylaminoacyl peptidase